MSICCWNKLKITGPSADIAAFVEKAKGKEECFSMNSLLPTPKKLLKIYAVEKSYNKKVYYLPKTRIFIPDQTECLKQDEVRELMSSYGAADWYSWRMKNWGTESDAWDTSIEYQDENTVIYTFVTEWYPPTPLLKHLAKMFTTLVFENDWKDENKNSDTDVFTEANV